MRLRRTFAFVALLIASVAVLSLFVFRNLGRWLTIDEPLRHARAIAVLGGGVPFRAAEAANLYNAGWADEIWLTEGSAPTARELALTKLGLPPVPEYELSRMVLRKLGVPPSAVQVVPGYVENTVVELGVIFRRAKAESTPAVILVSTKVHARRLRITWDAVSAGQVSAIVRYAADDPFDPSHWWNTKTDATETVHEVGGILDAWAGFPVGRLEH